MRISGGGILLPGSVSAGGNLTLVGVTGLVGDLTAKGDIDLRGSVLTISGAAGRPAVSAGGTVGLGGNLILVPAGGSVAPNAHTILDADGVPARVVMIGLDPPAVSDVVARQRWPWNGLVDVDYTVGGDTNLLAVLKARISFAAPDGRSWVATNFLAGAEPSVEPGRHRATWDTKADGATNVVTDDVVATVDLVLPSAP